MFYHMITDLESNKKLSRIVTELFLRGKFHLLLYHNFISKCQKYKIKCNSLIMKIPNKRELQQIVSNHSFDIDFKDFMKLYKDYTKEPCLFLVNDTTLPSYNPLRFRITIYDLTCYKMTVTEKIKTIEDKIEENKDQYDLD